MSEEQQVKRAKEAMALRLAYHRLFFSEDGEKVLNNLRHCFGVHMPAFLPQTNGYDPIHAALRDGQRQVILHIEHMLNQPVMADGNVDEPQVKVITE